MNNLQKSHPILHIIIKNTFTLFNFVNLVLALMVAFVGSYKNMLFILIAIANTLISIVNEVRAYKIVQKMRLISEQKPTVTRDGKTFQVLPEEIKKGDIVILSLGDQILYDSIMEEGVLEVNESFITGEQDSIEKHQGDELISGSFIVAGTAKAKVIHVGEENSITKLEQAAHHVRTADSKLFTLMNKIVRYISYTLIPVGALLLWSRFRTEQDTTTAITSTVAGLINMIPEGLILLTSSVLALATIRLSRKKVLVQDLYSIETLARVDTICLDKTGTLTSGNMVVQDFILPDGTTFDKITFPIPPAQKSFLTALNAILTHQMSENATTTALKKALAKSAKFEELDGITEVIPFSSDRKYSGLRTKDAEYLLGATEFITDDNEGIKKAKEYSKEYRVLAVVQNSTSVLSGDSGARQREVKRAVPVATGDGDAARERTASTILGYIRLKDEIRKNAPEIINYFYKNDIIPKVISGDDLATVQEIAKTVGIKDLRGIDLSTLKNPNYNQLVRDYTIFTRVKPEQKKSLIHAFKKQGGTVAMTGDGVNDILAMKEADCSIAIGEGSDAARRSAKLVLLDSDFDRVPSIIDEGRQSINNLERSTALFLAKTVYATILAVIFVVLPFSYPFSPIEMSLLNFTCIGFPGLILALEKNTARIKDRFTTNIIEYSFPIGLTVSICMLILSIISHHQNFTRFELTTTSVFIAFAIDLILIYWISKPLNLLRGSLILVIIAIMIGAFLIPFAREFFEFTFLTQNGLIIMVSIIVAGIIIFSLIRTIMRHLSKKFIKN
ncbi:HAD-IC family P-type ATPase [Candidatus Saccharibacteria bacterium]|nr:HAD-IC family P-type ATPase [Candidatus Saccharibacteria bacterium]